MGKLHMVHEKRTRSCSSLSAYFSDVKEVSSVLYDGSNGDVIIEDDVITAPPSRLTFTTGIKPPKATRHMSEVYTRSPPSRIHSVPARSVTQVKKATRRTLSRHGSKVNESRREHDKVVEDSPYSFMQSSLQKPQTIKRYRQLITQSRRTLEEHDFLTSRYEMPKQTRAYVSSIERIQRSRVILLTGSMGTGKTHLARDLMIELQNQTLDYHSIIMESPFDLELLENIPNPAIVMIDHCFGRTGLSSKFIYEYIHRLKHIKRLLDRKRLYMVLTSDNDTFEDLDEDGLTFLANLKCSRIDLSAKETQFTNEEQQKMLLSWSKKFDKDEDLTALQEKQTGYSRSPTICQLLGIADYSKVCENPNEAVDKYLSHLSERNPSQYLLLLLIIATGEGLTRNNSPSSVDKFESILEITQSENIPIDVALGSIEVLEKTGVLTQHANGTIGFNSRIVYLALLKKFVEGYREKCLQVLPVKALNLIKLSHSDQVCNGDNLGLEVRILATSYVFKSTVTCMSNALESKDPVVYVETASSALWRNDEFVNTALSVYGYHIFFLEDSNQMPLLAHFVKARNCAAVLKVLEFISRNTSTSNGLSRQLNQTKLETCRSGDNKTLKVLLKLSSEVTKEMLFAAIEIDDNSLLDYLVNYLTANGLFSIDSSLLQQACKCGSFKTMQYLLGKFNARQVSNEVKKRDSEGMSLLHHAAIGGDLRLFLNLEKLGADLKGKSRNGFTVLHFCSVYGHINLLKHICDAEKDTLNEKAMHTLSCADLATVEGHGDVVQFILDAGYDPDSEAEGENTLTHIAATNGRTEILRLMRSIREGQIHQQNIESFTPPQLAAKFGQTDALQFLFENGVRPETKTVDNRTFLHLAAFQGHLETVEFLCSSYPDLYKSVDADGNMVLHDAAAGGNVQIFERFVGCGIDPLQVNNDGATVLHDACYYGKVEMTKHLCLKYPAMINKLSVCGLSPAVGAALSGHVEILEYLASQGADMKLKSAEGSMLLHEAAYAGKIEMVKYLCTNFPYMREVRNQRSYMPIHFAAQEGHLEVFIFLLPKQTTELPKTEEEQTFLHIASYNGQLNIVKFLCAKIPSLMPWEDADGALAIHYAGRGGGVEVLDFLIEKRQDPRTTTTSGSTLLHLAAYDGNLDMVMHLCNNYPDLVDKLDSTGHSAAHYAAGSGEVPVLLNILQYDVDPMIRAENGSTLLMKAAYSGKIEMVKYLYSEYPEMISSLDNFGCSLLHYASCGGHINVLKYALEDGDPTARSHDGHSVLHVATYHAQVKTVAFLCNAFPELMEIKDNTGKTAEGFAQELGNETILEIFETFKRIHGLAKHTVDDSMGMASDFFCCVSGGKICAGLMALFCCRRK